MKQVDQETQSNQETQPVDQASNATISQDLPLDKEEKNKKLGKILTYVLASIVLIAVGAFGLWFYQEKIANKSILSPSFLIRPSPEIEPETIIPSDWKTYRNKGLKFSFKHPSEWIWESGSTSEEIKYGEVGFFKDKDKKSLIKIGAYDLNTKAKDMFEWFPGKNLTRETIREGIEKINVDLNVAPESYQPAVFYTKTQDHYGIKAWWLTDSSDFDEETILQIISTFEFEEKDYSLPDEDWPTYTNSVFKFRFSHPEVYRIHEVTDSQGRFLGNLVYLKSGLDDLFISIAVESDHISATYDTSEMSFEEFAIERARQHGSADGPSGSTYRDKLVGKETFTNSHGLEGFKLYFNQVREKFVGSQKETTEETVGPIYALDISKQTNNKARIIIVDSELEYNSYEDRYKENVIRIVNSINFPDI